MLGVMRNQVLTGLVVLTALNVGVPGKNESRAQQMPAPIPAIDSSEQLTLQEMLLDLDQPIVSEEGGISVRPPMGGELRRNESGRAADELFRVVARDQKYVFVVNRIVLAQEMLMTRSTQETLAGAVKEVDGFVDVAARQLPSENPGSLLRTELRPIADVGGAMLASRFTDATTGKKRLIQQAILHRTDKLYYVVTLTTDVGGGEIEADPLAQSASKCFEAIVESIELLDQSKIRIDQEDRLIRTRSLLLNWTQAKLTETIEPQRWVRIQKDGVDVGYSYIVEELANGMPKVGGGDAGSASPGIRIGIRTRLILPDITGKVTTAKVITGKVTTADTETWLWTRFDRSEEMFTNASLLNQTRVKAVDAVVVDEPAVDVAKPETKPDTKNQNWLQEIGRSNKSLKARVDRAGIDPRNPGVVALEQYNLEVTIESKEGASPNLKRELPPFYIPQAIVHLLPRLVPTNTPETFLVAGYVSNSRQVMLHYIDVLPGKVVVLGGKSQQVTPVRIRLGLEGATTMHFISSRGDWVGSEQEASKLIMIPATAAELTAIWKDADLSRPREVDAERN